MNSLNTLNSLSTSHGEVYTNITRYVANRVLTMVDPDGLELMLGTYGAGRGEEYASGNESNGEDSSINNSQDDEGKEDNRSIINRIREFLKDPWNALGNEAKDKLEELLGKYGVVIEAADFMKELGEEMADEMGKLKGNMIIDELGLTVKEIEQIEDYLNTWRKSLYDDHPGDHRGPFKKAKPGEIDIAMGELEITMNRTERQGNRMINRDHMSSGNAAKIKALQEAPEALLRGVRDAIVNTVIDKTIGKLKGVFNSLTDDAFWKELKNFLLEEFGKAIKL